MYKTTLAGHPLHPQLIVFPAGLLPFSLAMDIVHAATGNKTAAETAYYAMWGGAMGALAAGSAGAFDYFTIPRRSEARKTATVHAVMNLGLVALTGINLMIRRNRRRKPGLAPLIMSAAGNVGLFVSAWFGGHLVYEHGVRVKGVSPTEPAPSLSMPGDHELTRSLEDLQPHAPQ